MNIIICDDDIGFAEDLKRSIELMYENIVADICSGIAELDKMCQRNTYELAFIDVVLDENGSDDGIQAAVKVMKTSPDMRVIFITSYMERYAEEIYNYPGYGGFIRKPVTKEKIKAYIDRRMDELKRASGKLLLKKGKVEIEIPMDAVIYIESDRRRLGLAVKRELHEMYRDVNDDDKKIYVYTKLKSVEKVLNSNFVRTHQSYIINVTHTRSLGDNLIFMDNGEAVPISRPYMASVRRAYHKYKGEGLL